MWKQRGTGTGTGTGQNQDELPNRFKSIGKGGKGGAGAGPLDDVSGDFRNGAPPNTTGNSTSNNNTAAGSGLAGAQQDAGSGTGTVPVI